ncbi:MAG: hypothetical protein SFZ24_12145 [Planctomycetota bacterium]|nr:hypothetical protein [Planctomycetota bacterium]
MHINCIACGHRFDLGRSYDDYDGPVKCSTCRTLLTIRTQDGSVRGVGFFREGTPAPARTEDAPVQAPTPRIVSVPHDSFTRPTEISPAGSAPPTEAAPPFELHRAA